MIVGSAFSPAVITGVYTLAHWHRSFQLSDFYLPEVCGCCCGCGVRHRMSQTQLQGLCKATFPLAGPGAKSYIASLRRLWGLEKKQTKGLCCLHDTACLPYLPLKRHLNHDCFIISESGSFCSSSLQKRLRWHKGIHPHTLQPLAWGNSLKKTVVRSKDHKRLGTYS